jgi:hypothetical protein
VVSEKEGRQRHRPHEVVSAQDCKASTRRRASRANGIAGAVPQPKGGFQPSSTTTRPYKVIGVRLTITPDGLVAQCQNARLISVMSGVQVLPGPPLLAEAVAVFAACSD